MLNNVDFCFIGRMVRRLKKLCKPLKFNKLEYFDRHVPNLWRMLRDFNVPLACFLSEYMKVFEFKGLPENAETIWKASLKIYLFELKILGYPEIP